MSLVTGPPLAKAINVSLVPHGMICSSDISIGNDGLGNVPLLIPEVVISTFIESGSRIVNNILPSPPDNGASAGFP